MSAEHRPRMAPNPDLPSRTGNKRLQRLQAFLCWLAPSILLLALLLSAPWLPLRSASAWQLGLSMLALVMLIVGIAKLYAWTRALEAFERVLRDISQGRLESSTPRAIPAPLRAVGLQIDALGRQLLQQREQFEARMQAANLRVRQDLEAVQYRLQESDEALASLRQEFGLQSEQFSSITHELRTPLTAILGFSDLLRKTRLDIDQIDYLSTLDRSARGLLSMLNDVLDWSRFEAGRLILNCERFDLADAVEDVVSLLAPLAYEKRLELIHIVDHDVPAQLEGDAQRLRQIITNLLSNAIKFTDSGEVLLRVSRQSEQEGQVRLRIAISDTGVGLSASERERVFRRFEQVNHSQTAPHRRPSGSGLGLSIVQHLAGLMNGHIEVESQPGLGSTFTAVIRLGAVAIDTPRCDHLRGRALWICEPQASAERALSHSLQFWGAEVSRYSHLDLLLMRLHQCAAHQRPAVIIAGISATELDSPALQLLGDYCMEAQPPLLLLLTSASPADQQRAIDLGAARALPKSLSRQQLYRELCELSSSEPTRPLLQNQTLLVADNNLANRRYLATLGRELGATVLEAADGNEALALWREHSPAFSLIDYRMPGLDGAGVIHAIRRSEGAAERPGRSRLVATSAHLSPAERQILREAGADQVLIKPFDEAQLLRALNPDLAYEHPRGDRATRLVEDPGLLALLRQELPQQLKDLERAFERNDAVAARACAHTLNGTAAFYRLAGLKSAAADMEQQLAASAFSGVSHNSLWRVRAAVMESLPMPAAPEKSPVQRRVAAV